MVEDDVEILRIMEGSRGCRETEENRRDNIMYRD